MQIYIWVSYILIYNTEFYVILGQLWTYKNSTLFERIGTSETGHFFLEIFRTLKHSLKDTMQCSDSIDM